MPYTKKIVEICISLISSVITFIMLLALMPTFTPVILIAAVGLGAIFLIRIMILVVMFLTKHNTTSKGKEQDPWDLPHTHRCEGGHEGHQSQRRVFNSKKHEDPWDI